jgi:hypothetical protein
LIKNSDNPNALGEGEEGAGEDNGEKDEDEGDEFKSSLKSRKAFQA